ncbi:hypothetical protein HFO58_10935 [Rhizobium leguminosarum]|uniref:hypothetical protein n=1 Tax=Rhizobium leguminosarum TaxID=384 RepID=UPI001C97CEF3|nr:hypothetical protein [Rhizobium leguminosarum]MBY5533672.1 hypothetical protein [Rhizobium leguminosarum]
MKKLRPAEITLHDLNVNSVFKLDMAVFRGRGVLRRPIKNLLNVVLHRLGVTLAIEKTDKGWKAKAAVRGGRRVLPVSRMEHDTPEQAENDILLSMVRSLPQEIISALSRVGGEQTG